MAFSFSFITHRITQSTNYVRYFRKFMSRSSKKPEHREVFVESALKEEDREKILTLLNTFNEKELEYTKSISAGNAAKLVEYRTEAGDIDSLSEVQSVLGLGTIKLMTLCTKLIEVDPMKIIGASQRKRVVNSFPKLTDYECQDVESLVAFDVDNTNVTHVHMDRSMTVLSWEQTKIFDQFSLRYNHITYHRRIAEIVASFPEASIYVVEDKAEASLNLRFVPFLVNKKILEALFITILNKQFPESENVVYTLKSQRVNSLFNLAVGRERISPVDLVDQYLKNFSMVLDDLSIPEEFHSNFFDSALSEKNKLANVLLLASAFYRLIIFRDNVSW